ncbi:dUTP diphosphatase [Haliangium sp.]|uniref:dUTP diphosphatase n=1 Tax=Haliangium sp. TaxID=2663208 RepID=UPI003D10AA46
MPQPTILIRKVRADAVVPQYMSAGAAGMDLVAAIDGPVTLARGERAAIGTGLAMAIPAGYEGQVRPRSGMAAEHGLTVVNAPGTIDADYRGEVRVLLINLGRMSVTVMPGQRIAQLVIAPVTRAAMSVVTELPESARGEGGFGSTGS